MSITANALINDSLNFFKNQLSDLFILSFISATVSLMLYYLLVPIDDIDVIAKILSGYNNSFSLLTWINELSNNEKTIIIKLSLISLTTIFIGLILLIASVVTYLSELSNGNNISALQSFIVSLRIFPRIFILLIICAIIIYFGFILFILPGIILTIRFSLLPIILITDKTIMPLQAIYQSWRMTFRHWWLIIFILLFLFLLQILLTMLLGQCHFLPSIANHIISFTLNNLLTSFTLIYLFRLYMLDTKQQN